MDFKSLNIDPKVIMAAFQQNNISFMNVMNEIRRSGPIQSERNINKLIDLFIDTKFVDNIKVIINQLKNIDMNTFFKSAVLKNTCKMINLDTIDERYESSMKMVMRIYDVYGPLLFTMYSTILSFISMYIKTCDFDTKKLNKLKKLAKMVRRVVIKTGHNLESQETIFTSENKTYIIIILVSVLLYLGYKYLIEGQVNLWWSNE